MQPSRRHVVCTHTYHGVGLLGIRYYTNVILMEMVNNVISGSATLQNWPISQPHTKHTKWIASTPAAELTRPQITIFCSRAWKQLSHLTKYTEPAEKAHLRPEKRLVWKRPNTQHINYEPKHMNKLTENSDTTRKNVVYSLETHWYGSVCHALNIVHCALI